MFSSNHSCPWKKRGQLLERKRSLLLKNTCMAQMTDWKLSFMDKFSPMMQIRMVQRALPSYRITSWFQFCTSGGFLGIYDEYSLLLCHFSIVTKMLVGKKGKIIWGFQGLSSRSSDSIVLSLKWNRTSLWGFVGNVVEKKSSSCGRQEGSREEKRRLRQRQRLR